MVVEEGGSLLPAARKIFNSSKTMERATNTKLCNLKVYFYLKGFFWKISCFYHLSFLRYLRSLNPTSQIRNNFHTKLGKIKLLITFDGKIRSTWSFHQLFIIARGNYRHQSFDWWHHSSKWRAKMENFTFDTLGAPQRLSIWFSWKMKVNHVKTLSFPF